MILLFSICSVLAALAEGQTPPRVTITQGVVEGTTVTDTNGNYHQFYGIPYADSTSGSNRFKAPREAPSFQDILVANRRDIKCVRALGHGYEGTEDCLVANIFTPTLGSTGGLPVMVWIKGKEFDRINGEDLSFRNFVQKGVVVVSLNFRESILGFLCLGTEIAPGNAGLKDIIAGLKWVKANIAQFGGNPDDITLFGHGSGAAAVDLVTLSPMGKGLVQKAIAQSGNALAPWAVSRDNLKYALLVAEALGHEIETVQQLSEVFTRTSVSALMGIINELDLTDNSLAFAPCVERQDLESVEPFLTKTPSQIFGEVDFEPIPMIYGFVDNEGTIRAEEALEDDWLQQMQESFSNFIQPDLQFQSQDEETSVVQRIRQYYFPENQIDRNHLLQYLAYHGDTMILVSAIREVRNRIFAAPTTQVYLYQFSYSGTLGEPFVPPIDGLDSAAHSEELAYMFYNTPVTSTPSRDQTIGNVLVERWTNFAKNGNPTSETSEIAWLPYTTTISNFIRTRTSTEIDTAVTLEIQMQHPHFAKVNFWDIIYSSHFRDAQSNWLIKERDDEDEISTAAPGVSTAAPDASTAAPDASTAAPDGSTAAPDATTAAPDTTTPDPNSASTAIAYTFLIVTLFSLLSHIHSSLILS